MKLPEEVVALAERGIRLFPLAPNTKDRPLWPWKEKNSSNVNVLEEWNQLRLNLNWGALTGPESGFFVIDPDIKNGKRGLSWYEENKSHLPDTVEVRTPSTALHLYYRWPDFLLHRDNTGKLAPGVDILALDSYVVVPPSYASGGWYRFLCALSTEIAPASRWLLDQLRAIESGAKKPHDEARTAAGRFRHPQRVPELIKYAGRLRNTGMDFEDFQVALISWDRKNCDPPLGIEEVLRQSECYHRFKEKVEEVPEEGKIELWTDFPDVASTLEPSMELIVPALSIAKSEDRGSIVEWVGGDGEAKSWIGLQLAVAVATGGDFLNHSCRQSKVLYIDHENPRAEVRKRLIKITGNEDPIEDLKIWGIWIEQEPPRFGSATLLKFAQEYQPVIIIDPFQDFHEKKENDPSDMNPVMNYIRKLAIFSKNAVIFFHHPPLADANRGRGTTAIRGKCDIVIIHSLEENTIRLRMVKNRFGGKFTYTINANFETGQFVPTESPAGEVVMTPKVDLETLADLIELNPGMNTTEIWQKMGGRSQERRVVEVLKYGVKMGRLIAEKGPRNSTCYKSAYSVPQNSVPLESAEHCGTCETVDSTDSSSVPQSSTHSREAENCGTDEFAERNFEEER